MFQLCDQRFYYKKAIVALNLWVLAPIFHGSITVTRFIFTLFVKHIERNRAYMFCYDDKSFLQ